MNRRILIFLLSCAPLLTIAQEYYFKQYRVERGLPSDIIKATTQDALGFFWAATDEGLVKYDGINFTSYRGAMNSNYAKGFLTTRSGRLFAFSDLDLIEIKNQGNQVTFEHVCPVSRIASDTALSYPKVLFEDAQGAIWVSESQAVVRLYNNTFKRFEFNLANRSPQFLRAFTFFEDKRHNLFVSSFQGNVFQFNPATETFEPATEKFPADVEFIGEFEDNLIIGAREGVFEALLPEEGGYTNPVLKKKIPFVSYIAAIQEGKSFVATRGREHFIADLKHDIYTPFPNSIHNINHVFVSHERDIWLSGNEGLIMTRENLFQRVNDQVSDFIESITEDVSSSMIYYATSRTLYSYDRDTKKNSVVLEVPNGYFQSLLFTSHGLWAANAFKVFLIVDGKIKREFDFTKNARFITDLSQDAQGNIWLAIPGSSHAYRIDANFKVDSFRVNFDARGGVINVIRGAGNGIYIASAGQSSYLFYKSFEDSVFQNKSLPLNLNIQNEFNVTDIEIIGDQLWLATTEGLFKLENDKAQMIDLGQHFKGLPVKSIYVYSESKLLASTAYGMIFYDTKTGQHDLFNESSGLLSNTITNHGFFVGNRKRIWIGTAKGLCSSVQQLTRLSATPKPLFIQVTDNGTQLSPRSGNVFEYGNFISIKASSITFPENEVTLQYRILPDSDWQATESADIEFLATRSGTHTLEVRAKKNGLYSWSEGSYINFTINKPYWQQTWFYSTFIAIGAFLVIVTFIGVNARNKKRTLQLQALIDERTNELRIRNEELVELNEEKNNLIGIVAHDLKSPLKQILGILSLFRMTSKPDEETNTYLTMMETSTKRLDGMIMKILDVDAIDSKKMNLNIERLNFSFVLKEIADRYENDAAKKNIILTRKINSDIFVLADKGYLEQVLENLLSNAIKFSPFDRKIFINLSTVNGKAVAEIKDEGPGITHSDQKKLFGKYQKLSAQPTGDETSTGLGLSIVKKFVLTMKGEIWCESEYGSGASFFVSFPLIKN